MEVTTAIAERRSVRRFSDRSVDPRELGRLVEAAACAPSGSNVQAWHFVVVAGRDRLTALKSVSPGIFALPPAMIAICVDRGRAMARGGAGGSLLGLMDACFAAQNILLAAHARGLGTCVIRSFHQAAVGKLLQCPPEVVPEILVTVGYPEGPLPRGPRRRSWAEIAHLERHGGDPSALGLEGGEAVDPG
ncbi:MAG: nitroreductase family protein [bacterium]|nr:nitroreductase family protein [bacterium]